MAQTALRSELLRRALDVWEQEKKWSPNSSRIVPHLHLAYAGDEGKNNGSRSLRERAKRKVSLGR